MSSSPTTTMTTTTRGRARAAAAGSRAPSLPSLGRPRDARTRRRRRGGRRRGEHVAIGASETSVGEAMRFREHATPLARHNERLDRFSTCFARVSFLRRLTLPRARPLARVRVFSGRHAQVAQPQPRGVQQVQQHAEEGPGLGGPRERFVQRRQRGGSHAVRQHPEDHHGGKRGRRHRHPGARPPPPFAHAPGGAPSEGPVRGARDLPLGTPRPGPPSRARPPAGGAARETPRRDFRAPSRCRRVSRRRAIARGIDVAAARPRARAERVVALPARPRATINLEALPSPPPRPRSRLTTTPLAPRSLPRSLPPPPFFLPHPARAPRSQ